ncbi:HET-domain-containing protein [Dichotomopilus funicola]|uniref:HET-domain-containing protein n=1 Tax=Dichotomopilus funicola TaxID=1934379 RepID=A0AAN6V045_9PEZI|nr:HET-domain-containing protein [Dichotomopilus funicola]
MAVDPRWVYFGAEQDVQITTTQYCPQQPYVSLRFGRPETVPADHSQRLVVRRVTFTTTSHDQGFSGEEDRFGGTYDASFTWFEACVLAPSGHERGPRRMIHRNVHARFEYKTHVHCWSLEGADDDLRSWMSGIRPGDTVQIMPRAHFPAWTNYVRSAKIESWASPSDPAVDLVVSESLTDKNDYSSYRPLRHDIDEIRVVELQPGEGNQEIQLTLKYTHLRDSDRLEYEGLSYCWGDAEDRQQLLLTVADEHGIHQPPIPIHTNRNLFQALKQLRRKDTPRTLWIDLLCINQTDTDERTSQVALMGDIFASARTVCVWLGEPDATTAAICRAIESVSKRYDEASVQAESHSTTALGKLPHPHQAHDIIHNKTSGLVETNNDQIFFLPWFERVWVLQEVWKASHVQVFCGSYQLSWEALMQANHCLRTRGLLTRAVLPSMWTALFNVERDGTTLKCERAPRLDILHILLSTLGMKATDPRDKIFAPLTFGEETHEVNELPPEVKPNYSKDAIEVYADFTRWWIVRHASLRILSAVHTIVGRSWVNKTSSYTAARSSGRFDLSQRPSWMMWHEGFSEWTRGTLGLHGQCGYRASGDRVLDTDLIQATGSTRSPMSLPLKGIRLSTIASLDPYPFYQIPLVSSRSMHEAYVRLFDPPGTIGTWNSLRTQVSVGEPVDVEFHLSKRGELGMHYMSHWGVAPPSASGGNAADGPKPTWLPCHGNCMFTDVEGRIGLCPAGSRVGDIVVVLYGGNVPYLLRPKPKLSEQGSNSDGEYYLVGECYAEGFMGGEACALLGDVRSEEVFVLV